MRNLGPAPRSSHGPGHLLGPGTCTPIALWSVVGVQRLQETLQALEGDLVPFREAGWGSWMLRTRFGEAGIRGQGKPERSYTDTSLSGEEWARGVLPQTWALGIGPFGLSTRTATGQGMPAPKMQPLHIKTKMGFTAPVK